MDIKLKLDECINMCNTHQGDETPEGSKVWWNNIRIIMSIIKNPSFPHFIRTKGLFDLQRLDKFMANEVLITILDSLDFMDDGEFKTGTLHLIKNVVENQMFSSEQRYTSALNVYNSELIEWCYEMFSILINDVSILLSHRVECSKFLFFSQLPEYVEISNTFLKGLIDDTNYETKYRYEVLCCFMSETGLAVQGNVDKLNINVEHTFIYPLQHLMFFNKSNDVRYRILSGQYLLQLSIEHIGEIKDVYPLVEQELLLIAESKSNEHNLRADSADVLLRLGKSVDIKEKASKIISELGDEDSIGGAKSVYENKQNIHYVNGLWSYIEKMITHNTHNIDSFTKVHTQVSDLINEMNLSYAKSIQAFKSLNRISIDTATFTKMNLTTSRIFCYVWSKIINHESKTQLKKRLVEELIDMADTCSSGHCSRLINVFATFEPSEGNLISLDQQLEANIKARVIKRIKDITDTEYQSAVLCGMSIAQNSEDNDRKTFDKWLLTTSSSLFNELKDEFVNGGYMNSNTFTEKFKEFYSKF